MDPRRWAKIESVYNQALMVPEGERPTFLAAACTEDPEMAPELASLLGYANWSLTSNLQNLAAELEGIVGVGEWRRGARIGQYEIISCVGQGSMGKVYRARDVTLEREVAVKLVRPELTDRFRNEARVISGLNHPHICALYDWGEEDGQLYLVLEYISGETLEGRLRQGPLDPAEAITVGRQLAGALAHAHEHGAVHRDLKPSNIMLSGQGAKLLDFGVVKILDGHSVTTSGDTATGVLLGTPGYMSPEQILGGDVDPRSDLFSLGAVLYECLCGQTAFRKESVVASFVANASAGLPSLRQSVPDLPPALERIVAKCLSRSKAERFQTGCELQKALESVTLPETRAQRLQVRTAWMLQDARSFLFRHGVSLLVTVICLLMLGTGAFLEATRSRTEEMKEHLTGSVEAYDRYLLGRARLREKRDEANIQSAISDFQRAISKDGHLGLAYAGLADASLAMYDQKKDPFWLEKALYAAGQAVKLAESAESHSALGSVFRATGKRPEAIHEFQRALALSPKSDEANRRLASVYNDLGRKTEALKYYGEAIAANPYYWMNQNELGWAYISAGRYPDALDCFRKVIELAPELATGYLNSGAVLFQEGRYNEAIVEFLEGVKRRPSALAYGNLAASYNNVRQYKKAAAAATKAVVLDTNSDFAAGILADAYRLGGSREKATAAYDHAIASASARLEHNPKDAHTMARLARYFAARGKNTRALETILKARELQPEDVQILVDMSVVESLSGDPISAVRDVREALRRGYSTRAAASDPDLMRLRVRPEFKKVIRDATTSGRPSL